ncbi:septum formation family protein [Actinomadura kijaniata]|uniref:septum formation family protein n=1 Tax=Actinomadura kijaniata TaxID=46161 RepID=UPI003F1BE465
MIATALLSGCSAERSPDRSGAATGPAGSTGDGSPAASTIVKLTELPNGSCLANDRFLRPDGTVQTVDCKRRHMYRTYASTDLPPEMRDGPFPGYQKVYDFTLKFCDAEFAKLYKGPAGKDGRPVEYLIAPMEKAQWRPEEKRVVCATITSPNA